MFGSLKEFRKSKQLSQEEFGRKLGLGEKWRNYPNWETGRSPCPPDVQAKIVKLGYDGPFQEPDGEVTREDLKVLQDEVIHSRKVLEAKIEAILEVLRALADK